MNRDKKNADKYPKVRLFIPRRQSSYEPEEELLFIVLKWPIPSTDSLSSPYTSAVCSLYGRMIQAELGRRSIDLAHISWGGSAIQYWSSSAELPQKS